jgi:hypothetical protein
VGQKRWKEITRRRSDRPHDRRRARYEPRPSPRPSAFILPEEIRQIVPRRWPSPPHPRGEAPVPPEHGWRGDSQKFRTCPPGRRPGGDDAGGSRTRQSTTWARLSPRTDGDRYLSGSDGMALATPPRVLSPLSGTGAPPAPFLAHQRHGLEAHPLVGSPPKRWDAESLLVFDDYAQPTVGAPVGRSREAVGAAWAAFRDSD